MIKYRIISRPISNTTSSHFHETHYYKLYEYTRTTHRAPDH